MTNTSPAKARLLALIERATPGADSPCQDMQYTSAGALRDGLVAALADLEREHEADTRDLRLKVAHYGQVAVSNGEELEQHRQWAASDRALVAKLEREIEQLRAEHAEALLSLVAERDSALEAYRGHVEIDTQGEERTELEKLRAENRQLHIDIDDANQDELVAVLEAQLNWEKNASLLERDRGDRAAIAERKRIANKMRAKIDSKNGYWEHANVWEKAADFVERGGEE
jgi:hypothetical protein